MSRNTYRLINPKIEGSFDTTVSAKNSFRAGKKMYSNLSTLFTNHVQSFNMTLQNVDTGENTHFNIEEHVKGDGTVNYELRRLEGNFPDEIEETLSEVADGIEQTGGKRKRRKYDSDSDSSSSSSSSDYDRYPVQPVTKYVYYSLPYHYLWQEQLAPIIETRTFVPLFSFPINPTVEILTLSLPVAIPWV